MNRYCHETLASPNPPLTPSRLFPCSKNRVADSAAGGRAGTRLPRRVRSHASLAVRSQPHFPSDLAFPRLVRWHVRRAGCPSTAITAQVPSAAGCYKKKIGLPSGPQAAWGGYRYAGRVTLWASPISPPPCLHRDGKTALHWAAIHGHLPVVRALINAGAPLDIQDNWSGWAFWCGRVGLLVRSRRAAAGAAVANRKFTPLH